MDEKFAIAFIAAFFSFLFFVILDLWKTSREKMERNIRALRSIFVELNGNNYLFANLSLYRSMFIAGTPMIIKNNAWEKYCGEVIIPLKDRILLESIYNQVLM